jgi:transcriptional regulator with XRE-family HTH domain
MKTSMPMQLNNFIRFVRVKRGWTQEEFAKQLGYRWKNKRIYVYKIERGVYKLPVDFLGRLTKHLTVQEADHLEEILSDFRKFRRG